VGIQCTDGVTAEFGSGTVTEGGQVSTAGHVVADIATLPCSIFDVDVDHSTMIGTVLNAVPDSVYDAAVLNVSWVGATPAGIPAVIAPPALGDLVVSTGHPDALFALQYATGFVTAVNVNEMGAQWAGAFMADYSSNSGGSGGAVFNADCEWIAIHVGGFSDGFETSIALPF
jgi:S1-C subfamily serine protease